jgi:DsbC/DsbD-like thiol-disulfide interchange protein
LIAGKAVHPGGTPMLRAGIEIKLEPGWKTYWRYPGDSGVPPRIDLSRSENVKSIEVQWPAPQRWTDYGSASIGYRRDVILPLRVAPQDAAKPVLLRLQLDYAICEKLCVPAEAKAELALTASAAGEDGRLTAAETLVPKRRALGEASGLTIRKVGRAGTAPNDRVIVDVHAPKGLGPVNLFAEGPTPAWALPLPEPVGDSPEGVARFSFALEGLPPGESPQGAELRFTVVAGEEAIEVFYRLD